MSFKFDTITSQEEELTFFTEKVNSILSNTELFQEQEAIYLDEGYKCKVICNLLTYTNKSNSYEFNWTKPFSEIYCEKDLLSPIIMLIIRDVEFDIAGVTLLGYFQISIFPKTKSPGFNEQYFSLLTNNPQTEGPLTKTIKKLDNYISIPPENVYFPKFSGILTKGAR